MKKIYVIALFVISLATVVFFQNCSRSQFSSVAENSVAPANLVNPEVDSFANTFDESAKFSITGSFPFQQETGVIYEYKIEGGHRRPCSTEDDYLEGFEDRCSNATGFRVLSQGTLIKFYQFLEGKEIQYKVGYFAPKELDILLRRISEIKKNNAPLIDQNAGGPICMDGPLVTQVLLNSSLGPATEDFILAKVEDCHKFLRSKDKSAILVTESMERLYRRINKVFLPQKHILLEKRMQIGFRPMGMPGDISVRIYSDGRVLRKSVTAQVSQTQVDLIAVLSKSELEDLSKRLAQIDGFKFELKDLQEDLPICQDAPTISYSIYAQLLRPCAPPPIGLSRPDSCSAEYIKVDFARKANCHSFMDPRHVEASNNLIKFISQFN